jgi:NAD(P)H dehydrogenase (quinone)
MYFGMSVSAPYLEASVVAAAVVREIGGMEPLVNISQMSLTEMTELRSSASIGLASRCWTGRASRSFISGPPSSSRPTRAYIVRSLSFQEWLGDESSLHKVSRCECFPDGFAGQNRTNFSQK